MADFRLLKADESDWSYSFPPGSRAVLIGRGNAPCFLLWRMWIPACSSNVCHKTRNYYGYLGEFVKIKIMAEGEVESSSVANKVFTFKDDDEESDESLSVTIPEVLDPQFGMYVWPCAVVLAQFLWKRRHELKNKTLLEVGAGVALPGVLASRLGALVFLSDATDLPRCLSNCRRSCETNGLSHVPVLGLSWGHAAPRLWSLPPLDLILGSDVFYDPRDFESVLVTLEFLFRKNPQAQFWTSYQVRSSDWSLEPLLSRWSMRCELVPLASFGADKPELCGSRLPGNHGVQMLIVAPDDGRRFPRQPPPKQLHGSEGKPT